MWVNVKQVNNTRYMTYIYKGIIVALLLFVAVMDCHAQLPEKGDYRSRVGIKAPGQVQSLVSAVFERPPYKDPFAPLDSTWYMDFYENFKKLTDYAPYADYAFYSGAFSETQRYIDQNKKAQFVPDGTSIYERLIEAMPDTAMKMVVVEDILALGRKLIDNLDSINVVRNNRDATVKAADDTLSLPVAMTKYAHLYYKYAGNPKYYPAHMYDKVQARENYRKAFRMLVDNNIDPGSELEGFYVDEYYKTCEELFKSDEEKYYEQFLGDYLEILQTCDNLLIPFYDIPDSIKYFSSEPKYKKFIEYDNIVNKRRVPAPGDTIEPLEKRFVLSGAAASERISEYFLSMLPSHRKNHEYMERALYVMRELKADRTNAYYKYSETSYAIKPTYLNCLGCAFSYWEKDSLEKMDEFCALADSLAPDSLSKGLVHYYTAMEIVPRQMKMKRSEGKIIPMDALEYQTWDYEMTLANNYINKMMELSGTFAKSPKIEQREYPRKAAFRFYDIQRMIGRTKFETTYIKEAKKYIQMYASAEELIKCDQNLSGDISYINRYIKGASRSVSKKLMSVEEHRYLNNLHRAVSNIFFSFEGYAVVSFSRLSAGEKDLIQKYELYYREYSEERTGMTSQQKAQYKTYLNKKKIFK